MTMKILGMSASLRNMRHGAGLDTLVVEINKTQNLGHLTEYLKHQAQLSVAAFVEAGRKEHKSFHWIYKNLKKLPGTEGLSNSEMLLAAGLWGAKTYGAEIEAVSLSDFFEQTDLHSVDVLLTKVSGADGILLSGPVYFGDRSSLVHDLIRLLRKEPNVVKDKLFAGITVGAKRNGGQETCLIYQMLDFINLGLLAVGNDADTTAQYGGTGHAGDVGSAANDEYGIRTAIGTGKRIAQVLRLKDYSSNCELRDRPKIGIIILQDSEEKAIRFVREKILESELSAKADFRFFWFVNEFVSRCKACDMCPMSFGRDEVYRCVIRTKRDLFFKYHQNLIDCDAILLGGYSSISYREDRSVYQTFMERTRYLRRGDYVLSNCLVAPFLIEEVGSRENLQLRAITSLIRHHTIMHHPVIFSVNNGECINFDNSWHSLNSFVDTSIKLTAGRISYYCNTTAYTNYTPFGYTLSSKRDRDPENVERRKKALENRRKRFCQMQKRRIQS